MDFNELLTKNFRKKENKLNQLHFCLGTVCAFLSVLLFEMLITKFEGGQGPTVHRRAASNLAYVR